MKKCISKIGCIFILVVFVCLAIYFFTNLGSDKQIIKEKPYVNTKTLPNKINEDSLKKEEICSDGDELHKLIKKSEFIGSVLIFKNNQILLNKGYGYADYGKRVFNHPNTRFQIGSIQKSLTATLILKTIEKGKLSFETKLSSFYPQIEGAKKITIEDLLNMTSGLQCPQIPDGVVMDEDIIKFVKENSKLVNLGKHEYSPVNYIILAGILEKIYQQRYQHIFSTFYKNIGLTNFCFFEDFIKGTNNSKSYEFVKTHNYSKELKHNPKDFARELGSGNVAMSTGDMYMYLNRLLTGKIIPLDILQRSWQYNYQGKYCGGAYVYDNHFRLHGVQAGQRALVLVTKNMDKGVIMLTNCDQPTKYKKLVTRLFNVIADLRVEF